MAKHFRNLTSADIVLGSQRHKCRFVIIRRATFWRKPNDKNLEYLDGRPPKFRKHVKEIGLQVENKVLVYTKSHHYEWRDLNIPHIEVTRVYRGIPDWAQHRRKMKNLYANVLSFWLRQDEAEAAANKGATPQKQ